MSASPTPTNDVRAVVRSWPALFAARFETTAILWLSDDDARLVAQLVADELEDALVGLDCALDFSAAIAAKLAEVLTYVETMEEPMNDSTDGLPTPPPRERRVFKPKWQPPPPPWFDGPPPRSVDPNAVVVVDETEASSHELSVVRARDGQAGG